MSSSSVDTSMVGGGARGIKRHGQRGLLLLRGLLELRIRLSGKTRCKTEAQATSASTCVRTMQSDTPKPHLNLLVCVSSAMLFNIRNPSIHKLHLKETKDLTGDRGRKPRSKDTAPRLSDWKTCRLRHHPQARARLYTDQGHPFLQEFSAVRFTSAQTDAL